MMNGLEVSALALLNLVSLVGCCSSMGWVCGETACFNLYQCYHPFQAAMDTCLQDGVTLASISSEDERQFLAAFVQDLNPTDNLFWTGGSRNSPSEGFTWSDGSPFPFPAEVSSTSALCLIYRALPEDDFLGEGCEQWHQFICGNGSGEAPASSSSSPPSTSTSTLLSDSAGADDTVYLNTPVTSSPSYTSDTSPAHLISSESQSPMFQTSLLSNSHLTSSAIVNTFSLESSAGNTFPTNTHLIDSLFSDSTISRSPQAPVDTISNVMASSLDITSSSFSQTRLTGIIESAATISPSVSAFRSDIISLFMGTFSSNIPNSPVGTEGSNNLILSIRQGRSDISSATIVVVSTDITSATVVVASTDITSATVVVASTDITSATVVVASTDIASATFVVASTDIASATVFSDDLDTISRALGPYNSLNASPTISREGIDPTTNVLSYSTIPQNTGAISTDSMNLATSSFSPIMVTPVPSTFTTDRQGTSSVISDITATANPAVNSNLTHVCGCCWVWNKLHSTNTSRFSQDDLVIIKRKKLTTADDTRPSARGIGGGAVALLVGGVLAIVVMDAGKLMKDLHRMYRNLREVLPHERHSRNGV